MALEAIVGISTEQRVTSDFGEITAIVGHKFKTVWKRGNIVAWLRVQD